jgi:hypothetical protein
MESATRLGLSEYTVHNHIKAIFQLFDVHSKAELLALLINDGCQADDASTIDESRSPLPGTGA